MLWASPPSGYNSASINQQNNQFLPRPGLQGMSAQGYNSSMSMPSSYARPSSFEMPQGYGQQPALPGHPLANVSGMVRALRGGGM